MSIELYPSIAKIKRNGVYENLPGFVPETGAVATQQMIATSESSATAQYVHNKGEYFRLNDTLYQAIVKINVGDAIVIGANCEVAVIGNDLSKVANSIAGYELGIATSSHHTGDYFMVNETMYVATADIQVGDTISTSTNCRLAVVGDELSELKTLITDIESVIPLDLTWTIGKTVSSSGTISTQSTGATSSQIAVDGGNRVVRFNPTKDTNNVNIIIHVCQYVNGVFQSRTSLALSGMTLDAATTSICFNCSRAASTGITMTQQDVKDYFLVKVFRKYELSVDTVSKLRSITVASSIAESTYGKLLTNLPANIYIWCSGSWWTDAPWSSYFYLLNLESISTTTFAPMSGQGTQIAINPSTGEIKTRRISSGTWTTWTDNYDSNPVLYSFGDSLTWGAVWDSDQSTDLYQASTENQIPTRIAHAIGSKTFYNLGASGARFVKQSGDSSSSKTIVDIIKETTLTSADIVTIGGGRNDSATSLGDGATATANDGTICGAIVDALTYLTTNYPKLQIAVYGVTPQPTSTSHAPEDIYTRVFGGGWSLATYYTEVAKVCSRFGVPFIDWYDCTLILRWGVLSGGYSGGTQNWSHPLSEDIYKQMGNYIGGRVAAYYEG